MYFWVTRAALPHLPSGASIINTGSTNGLPGNKSLSQPDETAPSDVFFAADQLSSYYRGEVLAPIGGETLPG